MPKVKKRLTRLQIAEREADELKRMFRYRIELDQAIIQELRMIGARISSINDTLPALLHARAWKQIVSKLGDMAKEP